jgi:hypothetical protein
MIPGRRWKVEFEEDVRDMMFDSRHAYIQIVGNARVGEPFGHQLQYDALTRSQLLDRIVQSRPADHRSDDFGIEGRSPVRDTPDRIGEGRYVADPILQQITHTVGAIAQESERVLGFEILA